MQTPQKTSRIEARNVTAGYGGRPVLHGVSLEVAPSEFVGLIGPNGAGKSTLSRVISGVLPLTDGEVLLDGDPITRLKARAVARRLAVVPQSEATLFEFSVRDVVLMGRHPHVRGLSGETEEDFAAAYRAMAATDILALADRPITELSGGEHRRVLIARALAQAAPTLLLDEPTAHLDIAHQAEVLSLVRRLAEKDGTAVLAALHDLNLAAEFCDRLILLDGGRIAAQGAPGDVLSVETLERVYGATVTVGQNPASGRPYVLPLLATDETGQGHGRRIHVICGGGTGSGLLASLKRRGFVVTAGVLNQLDTDEGACTALGIEHVSEAAFSPIGSDARARCAALIAQAEAVVITDMPVGNGNLENLELAVEAQRHGKLVAIFGERSFTERDFTGGAAAALFASLVEGGALRVQELTQLEEILHNAIPREMTPCEAG